MSLTVIRGITNSGKTSALVLAVNAARRAGRTVRLCVPDSVQTRALPALSDHRILSSRDGTSAAIDVFASSSETMSMLAEPWPDNCLFAFEEAQFYNGALDQLWKSLSDAGHEVLVATVTDRQAHDLHELGAHFRTLEIDCGLLADAPASRYFVIPSTGASIPVCDVCWNGLRARVPSVLRERLVSREPSPGTTQIYQPPGLDLEELADLMPIREDSALRVSIMRDAMVAAMGEDLKGKSYLDLGCNTGFFCRSFASLDMNSHGVDVVAGDIVTARLIDSYFSRKPSIWTVADGVDFIERQSGLFDVVSSFSVFQWIYIQHSDEARVSAALNKFFHMAKSLVFFEMGYVQEAHYREVLSENIDRDWVLGKMNASGAFSSVQIVEEGEGGLKRDFFIGIRKQPRAGGSNTPPSKARARRGARR